MRALGWLSLLVMGCAEPTFSAHTRDNSVEDIQRTLGRSHAPSASGAATAYLVTGATPRQIVAWDLTAKHASWQVQADVRSRLYVGGGLVVAREGEDEIIARRGSDGQVAQRLKLAAGDKFVGVAADEQAIYYVVQQTGGAQRVSVVVAVDRTGKELWRKPAEGTLGAPVVRGGVLAVPFRYQNVSFLDAVDGRELSRVRAVDEQITFVRALSDGFYYGGGAGVYAFDDKSATGSRTGSSYAAAKLGSDQIRTAYWWDGYQLAQTEYGAFDRNRILWRAAERGGNLGFVDDTVVLQSYRYFFAFDAQKGGMRWAWVNPRVDLVGAELVGPTVVFASIDGDVGALDAKTGAPRGVAKTGMRLIGATFDAEGFTGAASGDSNDLLKTLTQIIFDPDARFTAVKVFAVDALGRIPGREASEALLKVVQGPKVPVAAQKKAGEVLVARKDTTAAPIFRDALGVRFDFAEDKAPRGVDVLARAVAAIDDKQSVPALAGHLLDPATPQTALKDVAAALVGLAAPEKGAPPDRAARTALRTFLLVYRADPAFLVDPSPLNIAAEGLLRTGAATDRRTVEMVAAEARTLAPVQKHLQSLLSAK